jgi:predicted HNH restriction endonuclease
VDSEIGSVPRQVLSDLEAESDDEEEKVSIGREGTVKAVVSLRRERSPTLRAAALRIHGNRCQVCNFSFAEAYGSWGEGFAEVHHIQDLGLASESGVETDPARDLAVLCSNCHRMIHRKPKRALSLAELREMVEKARET